MQSIIHSQKLLMHLYIHHDHSVYCLKKKEKKKDFCRVRPMVFKSFFYTMAFFVLLQILVAYIPSVFFIRGKNVFSCILFTFSSVCFIDVFGSPGS